MHPDVRALLSVQEDDMQVYALEDRLSALAPRLAALEKERGAVASQVDRLRTDIVGEESRHRDALGKVETHKALVDRSQRAYEAVTTPREANAASAQLEQTKRMAVDSERDAANVASRIGDMRHRLSELETLLTDVETRQSSARTELHAERKGIETDMSEVQARRSEKAKGVPRSVLSQYDRVRSRKRADSLVPLRGLSCSACDTAVPTQRRATLASSGSIAVCEGCGSLLYAAE